MGQKKNGSSLVLFCRRLPFWKCDFAFGEDDDGAREKPKRKRTATTRRPALGKSLDLKSKKKALLSSSSSGSSGSGGGISGDESSSSTTDSSSSSAKSSKSEPKPKPLIEKASEKWPKFVERVARDGQKWRGEFVFTKTWHRTERAADGARLQIGWEAQCSNKDHGKCRKSMTWSANGGAEDTEKRLKYWCLQYFSPDCGTQQEHLFCCVPGPGGLPSFEELDAFAIK